MDLQNILADRTNNMGENIIREILKVVSEPGMVSLAGGIPSPESFPTELFSELLNRTQQKYKTAAFQYGATEGFYPLQKALVPLLQKEGLTATPDSIMITSGSQGILDALGKVIINKGDIIVVESPTYLGALSAFNPYEPKYIGIESDKEGLIPSSLDKILSNNSVKFVYLIPTFQNPTGKTLSEKRRVEVADIIKKHNVLLVEDNPYSGLRYSGTHVKPIASLIPENTVYLSTLSKLFAPGLRIGYFIAPELIRHWLTLAKQGIDLHTSSLNQALAAEYISGGYLEPQVAKIIELYRPKQEAMLSALEDFMPEGFTWSKPEGGMFVWVEGPKHIDMKKVNQLAIKQGIAFVPGEVFYSGKDQGKHTLRLNFTMIEPEEIIMAVKKLGNLFNSLPTE